MPEDEALKEEPEGLWLLLIPFALVIAVVLGLELSDSFAKEQPAVHKKTRDAGVDPHTLF